MPSFLARFFRSLLFLYPFDRGQDRIIYKTFLEKTRFDEDLLKIKTKAGFDMKVFPNDDIGRHLYLSGQHDQTIAQVMISFCTGEETVLDVGANVGYMSCRVLHALPRCRVISVEPQPKVFAVLQENTQNVGGNRAVAINAALSDHAGWSSMAIVDGNIGASHLLSGSEAAKNQKVIEVPLITGEQLVQLAGTDRFDVIKIDVERHEEAVLKTLLPILKNHKPKAIVFEHYGNLNDPQSPVRRIFDELGFSLFGIHKKLLKWEPVPIEEMAKRQLSFCDYLATPR